MIIVLGGLAAVAESDVAVSIDTKSEYSSGSIPLLPALNLWYSWINSDSMEVVFFAYQSGVYNSPVITFIGQHFKTLDGTEVFIGNTLMLLETVNATTLTEVEHFFLVNSSVGFAATPVEKTDVNGVPHYIWEVRYETIDGFLVEKDGSPAARVILGHMAFSFDYYAVGNVSYLKTGLDIGEIIEIEPFGGAVNLEGRGLSLLYGTLTISSRPYSTLVNGKEYDASKAESPLAASESVVRIGDGKVFEFLIGENYTLHRGSFSESHRSEFIASNLNSIPDNARASPSWLLQRLEGVLQEFFPSLSSLEADVKLDYAYSSLLYRVYYPVWEGQRIEHDPTYVAYISPVSLGNAGGQGIFNGANPFSTLPGEYFIAIGATVVGFSVLILLVARSRRNRRMHLEIRNKASGQD